MDELLTAAINDTASALSHTDIAGVVSINSTSDRSVILYSRNIPVTLSDLRIVRIIRGVAFFKRALLLDYDDNQCSQKGNIPPFLKNAD